MARPIKWTEELKKDATDEILQRIIDGESCRSIFFKDRFNLPSRKLFMEWLSQDKELSDHYAKACELRAEFIFEEILTIADGEDNDIITLPDGRKVENKKIISRDRLRVEARKWVLSKMNPKKYGIRLIQIKPL